MQRAATLLRSRLPEMELAYLYGSYATGEQHEESDVDVAVLAGRHLEPLEKLDLTRELSAIFRQDVDLVDLTVAPTVLKARIIDGIVLMADSEFRREEFEARVLGELVRLNESRAGILRDVYERGSVHDPAIADQSPR